MKPVEIEAIRRGIPFADYLQMDALSNTDLKNMRRSLAYCRWARENPTPSTPAQALGTAFHAAVLEPATFAERVGVLPADFNGRTKEGKALKAQMEGEYDVVLKAPEHQKIVDMRDSVLANDEAVALLSSDGPVEATVTVKDPVADVMLKCRLDKWTVATRTILDLKKTRETSVPACMRQAYNNGHFRQMALYLYEMELLAAKGLIVNEPPDMAVLLFVHGEEEPYENTLVPVPHEIVAVEQERLRPLIDRFAECVADAHFPGWDRLSKPEMDEWIRRKYE